MKQFFPLVSFKKALAALLLLLSVGANAQGVKAARIRVVDTLLVTSEKLDIPRRYSFVQVDTIVVYQDPAGVGVYVDSEGNHLSPTESALLLPTGAWGRFYDWQKFQEVGEFVASFKSLDVTHRSDDKKNYYKIWKEY